MPDYAAYYHEEDVNFNGGSVHVSSAYSDWRSLKGEEQRIWWSYTKKINQQSDLVDLTSYCPASDMPSGIMGIVFQSENDKVDWEYYETTEYSNAVESFKANANYLWKSFDEGGIFLIKNGSSYEMYMQDGLFYDSGSDKYFQPASYLGTYSATQLSKVMFFWASWEANEGQSWSGALYMRMMYQNSNTIDIGQNLPVDWDYHLMYENTSMDTLALCDPDYTGAVVVKAEWIWRDLEVRNFFGPSNLDNYSHVSGSAQPSGIDWEYEPYANDGFSTDGGGNGQIDRESDQDGTSDSGNIGILIAESGLVRMYNPTTAQISSFNQFLFDGLSDSVVNTLKKLTSEPMQYVISMGLYHFTPSTSSSGPIMFGGVNSGVSANIVSSTTKKIDCGSVQIPAQFQSFLDYNPYSTVELFLPYVGFVSLSVDEIIGSSVKVVYNIDLLSGSCIAEVHISRAQRSSADDKDLRRILYTYSGNCCLQVPVSSIDQRGLVSALSGFVSGVAGGAASGGPAGAAIGAVGGAANLVTSEKVSTNRGSSIGANVGYLGKQIPYFTLGRPITCIPYNFGAFEGWTSNIRKKVSSLKGYTEIDPDTVWTNGFAHATDEEAQMIKDIMNGGVYL